MYPPERKLFLATNVFEALIKEHSSNNSIKLDGLADKAVDLVLRMEQRLRDPEPCIKRSCKGRC